MSQRRKPLVINPRLGFLIFGSILLTSTPSAQAAHDGRTGFQEFLTTNAGMSRHMARRIYRDQFQDRQPRSNWRAETPATVSNGTSISPSVNVQISTPRQMRLEASNQSLQFNDHGHLVKLASGINLDLNSQDKNIVLGQNLFETMGSVEIQIGGSSKILSAGDHVTAAEYVAVKQVLNGATQSLALNTSGQATNGDVDLSSLTQKNDAIRADSLVVPVSVTAIGDFTRGSDFRLVGDLDNFGTVTALASEGRAKHGLIHADNITNHSDARIASTVKLTLSADGTITNHGTITSTEDVTLVAGQINNDGNINSEKHVNVNASTVNNSGQVVTQSGNINVDVADVDSALIINNANGTLSALNGAINIRTESYSGNQDTRLNGGNVLSKYLNLNAGEGTIDVAANQLTGTVNTSGTAAHITAATDNLSIGSTCLTGDPTFFNTAGSIAIDGSITVAEALTIVATGNININNGSNLTAAGATQGFPITLIAGASFVNSGGANQTTLGPIPPNNTNNGGVTINGGSVTGGAINFNSSSGNDVVISTRPTGGTGNGANVTLVAFAGTGATSGRITTGVPIDQIFTGGKGVGNNGSITMIASGLSNGGTFLPTLDTTGGKGAAGNITVTAADPVATNVSYNSAGILTAGNIIPSNGITGSGSINFVNTFAGNGTITAKANSVQVSGATDMTARRIDLSGAAISVFGDLVASSLFTANATGTLKTVFTGVAGSVTSPVSILTAGNTIGTFGQEFVVHGGTIIADGAAGVAINSTQGITIAGGSTQTGAFIISANGDTNITGDVSIGNGSIDIHTAAGGLSASAVSLTTGNGNVSLANLGVSKSSKVTLIGTTLSALGATALGDITVSVGTPGGPVDGKAPKKNVNIDIQNAGQIFYGKGITTLAPVSNLTANGANIFFNNPISRKNIVLSGVNLLAGP